MGAVVLLAGGALIHFANDDATGDWVADDVARAAQALEIPSQGDAGPAEAGGGEAVLARNESPPRWVSNHQRVLRHEALPCTGSKDPINFRVFSAGPAVGGVPITNTIRRCDPGALADEMPSNYFAYIYGDCEPQPDVGCLPPLQIRSYPACERTYADYSFEGKPLPYTELPPIGEAKVFEIEFLVDHRIEIYTGTSTIAISAADWSLAEQALDQLRSQASGEPAATAASFLAQVLQGSLAPPVKEAIEGDLPCQV